MNGEPPFVVVLGTAQDGGCPQAGCRCDACQAARADSSFRRWPACLGIVDPERGEYWLVDATPRFPEQVEALRDTVSEAIAAVPDGILLTHAHMGHYLGLMQLGQEVMGAADVPVWAMPRMRLFLSENSPWRELIEAKHIDVRHLVAGASCELNTRVQVTPLVVPHRGDLSETVAFQVTLAGERVLWLPDIDHWDDAIEDHIKDCQVAWLDGTFFDETELPGRDMSTVPHPTISESLERFGVLPRDEREKIRFIHLNHSNPVGTPGSDAAQKVLAAGMHVSVDGERWPAGQC